MPKPIPSLKKPSLSVESMAAFVDADHKEPTIEKVVSTTAKSTPAPSGRRLQTRKDGTVLRKVTVYLPRELDKQLTLRAATNDVDRSDIVAEALQRFLKKEK